MPFTSVPAAQIELLQNAVDGDIFIPGFSRRAFLNGATAGLLSLAPPLTMVSNLLTVAAPVRNYDLTTFAGLGLSIETTVVAGNFPVVASRDVQVKSTAVTGQLWTYPSSRQLGQLMVMAIATAALTTITTPTGWTLVQSQAGTESRTAVYERVVDGLEPTDLTITFGTASAAVIRTWMIDIGDGGVEAVAGINDSAAGTSLDLATISPTWATAEATSTLYIAILGLANDVVVSGFPAGYTVTGQDVSASATANLDCALAYAERSALGSSENPGAFTYAASRSTGHVIAIKPKVTARLNWDGLSVRKAGVLVGTQRAVNLIEGTNISLTMADNPGTGAVDITVTATGGAGTPDWATVLAVGHVSGANNAHIDVGQILSFGIEGSLPPTGQIRSSTDLTIRAVGSFETISTATMQFQTLGNIPIKFVTNTVERMEIRGDGAIEFNGITGTNGQFLTSTGGTTPPVWATFAFSMMPSMNPDTFLGRLAGTGTPNPQVFTDIDSTSIIWDGTSHTFQRAAFTGDVTAAQDVNALTIGTNVVTNAKAAQMAANTIKANATAALANAADLAISADSFPARVGGNLVSHPFATLFGTYLSYSAGVADWIGLDVRVNTGALTGTRHRINVIGTAPISVAAADDGANDEVDITISIASIPLTSLSTVAALSVIANAVNSVATPTAVASSADDTVFRRTGATLNWGQLTVGMAPNDVWTYAKIQNVSATSRFLGRITAAAGDIEELTGTQATTLLNVFTTSLQGLVPASGGGTANFLRADGTFAQAAHTIRANGGGFTLRLGLNFANTTSIIAAGADDAGANETDITFQRAALTGEVTAAQNVNATVIDRVTNFDWTGEHYFESEIGLVTSQTVSTSNGPFDVTLTDGVSRLVLTGTNPIVRSITGGTHTGRIVLVYHGGNGILTMLNQGLGVGNEANVFNPDDIEMKLRPRQAFLIQANGTAGWRSHFGPTNSQAKSVLVAEWHEDFEFVETLVTSATDASVVRFGNTTWYLLASNELGSIANIASEAGHPGIVRMTSGTTDNSMQCLHRGGELAINTVCRGDQVYVFRAVVRSTFTSTKAFSIGFSEDPSTVAVTGVGNSNIIAFMFDSDNAALDVNVQCVTREADGTATVTDSGVSLASIQDTWALFEIRQSELGTVRFFINDVLVATNTTAVPDAEVMNCGIGLFTRTAAATVLDIDFVDFQSQPLTRFG